MPTIHRESYSAHRCKPPGIWQRIREDIGPGSLWECPHCKKVHKFREGALSNYWTVAQQWEISAVKDASWLWPKNIPKVSEPPEDY